MKTEEINLDVLCGEILRICWDGTKIFDICTQIKQKIEPYTQQEVNKKILPDIENISIANLDKEQMFYITIVSRLICNCVEEKIITPTQKHEIFDFMLKQIETPKR